nr:MAG: alpha/beta hydrolase [Chloroflexota bacterium]
METRETSLKASATRLDVRGLRIRCFVAGEDGPPVILLHGGGLDSAELSWADTIGPLSTRYRVYAPDLPGYGQSDRPDVTYSLDFYVGFLDGFYEALGLEKASLIGLSLGGGIALSFTLRYPERVDRLVVVGPYGIAPQYSAHKLSYLYIHSPLNELSYRIFGLGRSLIRWSLSSGAIRNAERLTPELIDQVYAAAREPGAGKAFASFQRDEFRWNGVRTYLMDRLPEIQTPTLIVNGEKDNLVPASAAEQAHRRIRNSRLHILAGCGHWAQRDNPEEFNRVVLEFLDESAG